MLLKKGEGNSKVEEGKVVSPRKIAPTPSVFGAGVEGCEMARKGARGCVRPRAAEGFFWAGEGEVAGGEIRGILQFEPIKNLGTGPTIANKIKGLRGF